MRSIEAVTFDAGDTLVDLGEGRGDYEARSLVRAGRVYDALAAGGALLGARDTFCPAFAAAIEARYQAALAELQGLQVGAALSWYFAQIELAVDDALLQAAATAYSGQGSGGALPLRLGALETLRALAASGLRLGVISNTIQPGKYLDALWAGRGLLDLFSVTIYSSEVGVAKPHPGIFRAALEALGVAPERAAHVGDRLVADVAGAQRVGMQGILIEVAHRAESAADITPDARIRELPELLDVLEI